MATRIAAALRGLTLLASACCATGWSMPSADVRCCPGCGVRSATPAPAMSMLAATQAISRNAPAPTGPDPYKLVYDDLEAIKGGIKKVLTSRGKSTGSALSSNEVLSMAAREFMERKGKSFRPMLVLLIGRATDPDFVTDQRHMKLAVIAEMIHTASLIHEDVLEEDETDTSQGTLVHQEVALDVGNKVCILAGDFLLAKAAVELSLLETSAVTEIVARGLEMICEGGMMGFNSTSKSGDLSSLSVDEHLGIVSNSIGQLLANVCQCSAILSGHEPDSLTAKACHLFGEQLAMARHLVGEADALEAALRKSRRNPKQAAPLLAKTMTSTPVLIASQKFPEIRSQTLTSSKSAAKFADAIERSGALDQTQARAEEFAQAAADSLAALPSSATRDALVLLCHKVISGTPIK